MAALSVVPTSGMKLMYHGERVKCFSAFGNSTGVEATIIDIDIGSANNLMALGAPTVCEAHASG